MDALDPEFARAYQAMQARYLQQVKGHRSELTAAGAAGAADTAANAHEPLRKLVHNLRGSAGFYGYPAIGHAAARVEDWLVAVTDGEVAFALPRMRELLAALVAAIDAAEPPPDP